MSPVGQTSGWTCGRLTALRARYECADPISRAALALLVLASLKAALWALISQDVPDELGYFKEIANIAATGRTGSISGHIVGVWAYLGAMAVRVGWVFGAEALLSVRLLGGACTVGSAWLGYRTGRMLTDRAFPPLAALMLIAFNPMYSFMGSSANSDTMQALWSSAAIHVAVVALVRGATPRRLLGLAGFTALVCLTKTPRAVPLVATALLALVMVALLRSDAVVRFVVRARDWLATWSGAFEVAVAVAVVVVLKPLYEPLLALDVPISALRWFYRGTYALPSVARTLHELAEQGGRMAEHFWGYFGHLHVPGPRRFYAVQQGLLLLAAAGAAVAAGRAVILTTRRGGVEPPPSRIAEQRPVAGRAAAYVMLVAAVAVMVHSIVVYGVATKTMLQGRYLVTFVLPIYVLLASGMAGLVPRRFEGVASGALLGALVTVNGYALFYIVIPYFY